MLDRSSDFRARLEHQLRQWGMPDRFINDTIDHLTVVSYQKDEVIFLRGSSADFLFCLLNGFAKLYLPHYNGNRTLVVLARPVDLLGFVDRLDSQNHRGQVFEARALTKCSVGLVSRDHLVRLLRTLDPESMTRLLEHVNTLWSSMFEWYATFMALPFRGRLQLLLENLKARVGALDRRGVLLLPPLTHEDLAEMIGSSRPMISRLINEMTLEGLLIRTGKQHYVVASTGGPERVTGFESNQHGSGETLFTGDRGTLSASDRLNTNTGLRCISSTVSTQK